MSADSAPASPDPHPSSGRRRGALRAGAGVFTAVAIAIAVATCGSPDDDKAPTGAENKPAATAGGFPVTVAGSNGKVTLDAQPEKIVSLSPTATEMLFAIGAGPQVVAVDDQSSYPAEAPKTKLSGYQPNAEAVAKYDPDLVVLATDANGIVASLEKLGVKVLLLPSVARVQQSYNQTGILGAATGHTDDAGKVIADTQTRVANAIKSMPPAAKGQRVYHELDPTYYSATSATFVGDVYSLLGLKNIADAAKDTSGGFPQLSAEFVVKAAPELVVLADGKCCKQDAATVAARPGFDALPAVKNDMVIGIDDDIASRWGPRVADFAEAVAAAYK
jgi:ABC-type Fe3+-hydroxamate transport system substrate-binding protein